MSEIKTISGDIVTYGGDNSITDVKSLTVDLEPIQDLNGYSNPWVGGGGKNLADKAIEFKNIDEKDIELSSGITIAVGNDGKLTLNGTTTEVVFIRGAFNCPNSTAPYTWALFNNKSYASGVEFSVRQNNNSPAGGWASVNAVNKTFTFTPYATPTKWQIQISSGVTFNNDVIAPMIVSGSVAPTIYEPYSNICPISGRTEVETNVTGVNVWDEEWEVGSYNSETGAKVNNSTRIRCTNKIPCKENTSYYFKSGKTGTYGVMCFYDRNVSFLSSIGYDANRVFTTPNGTYYLAWTIVNYGTTYNNDISINYPSTDREYHAYEGNTYTTALGQTVYGGTLDVISGELTVDRASVDLGTLNYSLSTERYPRFYTASLPNIKAPKTVIDLLNGICEAFDIKTAYETYTGVIGLAANENGELRIYAPTYSDATAFKTAMSGVQLVYELATPQTYQLTAQQIEALLGVNNLWASGGEVTLSYTENVLMPESVSINGKYLEDIIDGYLTLGTSGRRSLGRELDTYSVGSADGETVKGDRFPSRKITVNYVIQSDSEEELINSVNQLNNILNQDEADFVFRDEPDKFFTGLALLDAEPKKYRHAVKGTWTLYCAYPFKRSVEPITLVSTNDASISGNSATFVFDYNGTRPARPVLRARFASAKSGGDYSEDGDCGFVAFLDSNENIIQLGNPEVVDVDQYAKNGTLANSSFNVLTGWTPTNVSSGQITDTYWNNGAGQTQQYAKPTGTASLTRTTAGAVDFEFDIVHRLCVSAAGQTGKFEVLTQHNGNTVVGFKIEKTGNGTAGVVSYILNNKVVGTDNIDLSYYNTHFGYCNRTAIYTTETYYVTVTKKKKKKKKKVQEARTRTVQSGWSYTQSNLNSGWTKDGGVVTFSVGNLPDRTFKSSDIENTPAEDIVFNFAGSFHTNALHSCAMIAKAGVPFAEIPNVFTAGDIVQADCNDANVTLYRSGSLEGHLEPQYGALGNDWEDFVLKPGQNVIRAVWSDWVNTSYKPLIQIIFNEVYL